MRPLHALLVLIALVGVLVLAFALVQDGDRGRIASATPEAAVQPDSESAQAAAELHAPTGEDDPTERVANVAPTAAAAPPASARSEEEDGERTALTGRVVDTWGKPVRNATVYAAPKSPWTEGPLDRLRPELTPWIERVETRTDDVGRFRVEVSASPAVRVAVRAASFVPWDGDYPAESGVEREVGSIALEPSVVLAGQVVDATGRPVAGAELLPHDGDGMFLGPVLAHGGALATTDEQGRFRIDQLAAGPWRLLIQHGEHPDQIETGATQQPGETSSGLQFVLEPGLEIRGRVTGAPPEVLADIVVVASPELEIDRDVAGQGPPTVRREPIATDGSFVVRGLRAGRSYRLQGREAGGELSGAHSIFGRRRTASVVAAAGDLGVELPASDETAIVFHVVDGVTGEPIERFDVSAGTSFAMPLTDEQRKRVRDHPEGRVRFGNLAVSSAEERVSLVVDAVGYERLHRADIVVRPGADTDLGSLRLNPVPTVTVVVVDADSGVPIADARVQLRKISQDEHGPGGMSNDLAFDLEDEGVDFLGAGTGMGSSGRTDDEGRVTLTSLPGEDAQVRARANGFAPYKSDTLTLPVGKDLEHEVRLGPGGSVVVQVVDAQGEPQSGMSIEHEGPGDSGAGMSLHGSQRVTDAAGELVFENLVPGTHAFRIGSSGSGLVALTGSGGAAEINVVRRVRSSGGTPQRSPDWSEVELLPRAVETVRLVAKARADVTGTITEDGLPLAGATVRLTREGEPDFGGMGGMGGFGGMGGDTPEARTSGRGAYALTGVEVGEWTLKVTHPTRAMPYETSLVVVEGENELDLDLAVTAITGVVTDEGGEPLVGIRVSPERAEGPQQRTQARMVFVTDGGDMHSDVVQGGGSFEPVTTNEDGEYELRGVAADVELVVKAEGPGVQPGRSEPVRLAPGERESGIDVTLAPGGTLPVRVELADGSPGKMCMVRASWAGEDEGVSPETGFVGMNGKTRLDGLKPGPWTVSVQPMGMGGGGQEAPPEQVVEVEAGDNAAAVFTLP